jgi:hypothetical protein
MGTKSKKTLREQRQRNRARTRSRTAAQHVFSLNSICPSCVILSQRKTLGLRALRPRRDKVREFPRAQRPLDPQGRGPAFERSEKTSMNAPTAILAILAASAAITLAITSWVAV